MTDPLEALAQKADSSPDDPWAWLDLARALFDGGASLPGRHVLQRAAGVAGQDPAVWLEIGRTLERANATDEAVDAYRQVCRLAPGAGGGELSLSRLWLRDDEPEAAEMEARNGLLHQPEDRALHAALARALAAQERFEEALSYANKAIDGTDAPDALALAARLHRRLGDLERAKVTLERLFAIDPQDAAVALDLAEVALANNDVDRAREVYEAADRAGVVDAPNSVRLASGFTACGRFEAALAALGRVAGEHSMDGLVALERGRALEALGRDSEALDAFSRAISASPPPPRSAFHFGRVLARLGRNQEAATHLLRAAADAPQDEEVRAILADVLGALGGKPSRVPSTTELDVDVRIFSLPELLEFLAQNRSTGVLELTTPDGVARLTMQDGGLVAVAIPNAAPYIDRLKAAGLETDLVAPAGAVSDLDALLAVVEAPGTKLTALATAVSRSIVRALVGLVQLDEGRARFFRADANPRVPDEIGVSVQAALFDAIRRLDERRVGRETSSSQR